MRLKVRGGEIHASTPESAGSAPLPCYSDAMQRWLCQQAMSKIGMTGRRSFKVHPRPLEEPGKAERGRA